MSKERERERVGDAKNDDDEDCHTETTRVTVMQSLTSTLSRLSAEL